MAGNRGGARPGAGRPPNPNRRRNPLDCVAAITPSAPDGRLTASDIALFAIHNTELKKFHRMRAAKLISRWEPDLVDDDTRKLLAPAKT